MAEDVRKNLVIIGGGPAGYVGAIRASQLKANVTLIEKEEVGGVCLNVGCIPTKVLTSTAHLFLSMKRSDRWGLKTHGINLDFPQVMRRKQMVAQRLVTGVKSLLKTNGVNLIKGTASFLGEKVIEIKTDKDKIQKIEADKILIATGSVPIMLPIPGMELEGVVDSTGALCFREIPKSMLVIGGGAIGCEFAYIYHSFGTQVTIVEMLSQILPGEDHEIVASLRTSLEKAGIKIFTDSKVSKIASAKEGKKIITISSPKGEIDIEVEKVLVSVGRKANTKDLGLEKLGIKMDRSNVMVDEYLKTNLPDVYASGDCIGNYLLAHVASMEAELAVENALGSQKKMDYTAVPRCIFTHPEIGSVGLTEKQATDQGVKVKTGKFPFIANGRAQAESETEGMVKIIADANSSKILGAHILGPRATDLIAELTLAMKMGAKTEDLIDTIHAHPTLSEPVRETALKLEGRPIHIT
ncbi:MAG: dihydrolipoyl dehydrogenase [candidate division Zixibacteria bacterium]|nr:dihydrolipoyl dehydrogenase [candidate division Zixibacteria bacterium]